MPVIPGRSSREPTRYTTPLKTTGPSPRRSARTVMPLSRVLRAILDPWRSLTRSPFETSGSF